MCILLSQQNSVLSGIPIVDKGRELTVSMENMRTAVSSLAIQQHYQPQLLPVLPEAVILILRGHY